MTALVHRLRSCSFHVLFIGIWLASPSSLSAQSIYAHPYTVVTLAGVSTGSSDWTGTNPKIFEPNGMAVDGVGNVFVADMQQGKIRKITPAGVVTTFFDVPQLIGQYYPSLPSGIALDASGNFYVASSGNNAILKITPDGAYAIYAGTMSRNPDLPQLYGGFGNMNDPSNQGYTDGPADKARFNAPVGIALDQDGNVYVADGGNRAIRKITPQRIVSTLAGGINYRGINTDGTGVAAFFDALNGIATDRAGNVYVPDFGLNTIRKITPTGNVTTIAGVTDHKGNADGPASVARFYTPLGVAVDSAGNIFVADGDNATIREISTDGQVTTVAGLPGVTGGTDGTGSSIRLYQPRALAIGSTGILYIGDGTVRTGTPSEVSIGPSDQSVSADSPALFGVTMEKPGSFTYQWQMIPTGSNDGISLTEGGLFAGTSTSNLTVASSTDISGCRFRCIIKSSDNVTTVSEPGLLNAISTTAGSDSHLVNISTRSFAGAGNSTQIAGFILQGPSPRKVLIRAGGPYLSQFSVDNVLADPQLTLYAGANPIVSNDDWGADRLNIIAATTKVQATPFAEGSKDAAIVATLQPGVAYTAQVSGKGSGNGIAIVEVYDADDNVGGGVDSKLINISTRSFVGTDASIEIGGFILRGTGPKKVLIRAGGPYLTQFGVNNVLADPVLSVFRGSLQIARNDDWSSNLDEVTAACSAANVTPYSYLSADSAIVLTLNAGTAYTAQVTGKKGSVFDNQIEGNALIEIYELP